MNKKLWMNFIKDHWLYSLLYFIAFFGIVVFYQATTLASVEVIYPFAIVVYLYLIILVIRGITYFSYHKRLKNCITNPQYDLQTVTAEQKEVSNVINEIHHNYIKQLHTLQAEDEMQRRFLAQWIHNLKTPISVIDLTTQNQYDQCSDAKAALVSISEENEKLHHSVEQLLSLLRLNNFTKDYIPEQTDLKEEIRQVINGLKNQFILYHVFPELSFLTEDTFIFTDRKWHRLMLEQFISNAVKYSVKHGGAEKDEIAEMKKVWITLCKEEGGLRLTIRDEGIGIPEYDLGRIFEPFFTGDNGREARNSTGIGLYIADMAANRLGHQIEVASVVGEGTTVSVLYKTVTQHNLSKL